MHPHYIAAGHWAHSLRVLTGHPLIRRGRPTCAFASGCRLAGDRIKHFVQIASDTATDLVHIAFDDITASDPAVISLAICDGVGAEWIPDVRLWAANENSLIEFLANDCRWYFGAGGMLTDDELPPMSARRTGEAIAMRRWRERVATTAPVRLSGSFFVPNGDRVTEAIPLEDLNTTA